MSFSGKPNRKQAQAKKGTQRMDFEYSDKVKQLQKKLTAFMDEP